MVDQQAPFVLCVCQYGHSRSVALARALHSRDIAATAAGWATAGRALEVMFQVAALAVACDRTGADLLAKWNRRKLYRWDIGPDRWANPYAAELAGIWDRRLSTTPPCRVCLSPNVATRGRPALDHDALCPVKLSFYGGPEWPGEAPGATANFGGEWWRFDGHIWQRVTA